MRIIVTGSRGLIGKTVVKHLRKEGNEVIECSKSLGHDLSNEDFVKKWFATNKADCLVNLFALSYHVEKLEEQKNNLFDIELESLDQHFKVNLTSLFSVCREFARNNKKGSIVNFSSVYGIISPYPELYSGGHKHVGYCISKAGVIQLTKYLATHLASSIRVNCVVLGGVKYKQDKDFVKKYSEKTPLKRMMNVKEVNGIVDFLCSEKSSYSTGGIFTIDGGWTAW